MAQADHDGRCADGAEGPQEHRADASRGSHRGGFRQKTLLPPDDAPGCLRDTIPNLSLTDNGIEHRLTKPYHPWTNGQAERMNRTIKDATVKVYHYDDLESLKALRWRTPYQVTCEAGTNDPSIFKINPHHLILGLHT